MTPESSAKERTDHRHPGWFSWLLGIAALVGVVFAVRHFSEAEAFVTQAREAKPLWLIAALVLQAATYLTQGEIWRAVGRAAGTPLSLPLMYKLALAKLFLDQALPSAGLSGTVVVTHALEKQGGLPRPAVLAGAVINTTSFLFAYAVALSTTITILALLGHATFVLVFASGLFILLAAAVVAGILVFAGRDVLRRYPRWLIRYRLIQEGLNFIKDADRRLVHNFRLQLIASCLQLTTFLLDAMTLWVLIRSLGVTARPGLVFASFMVANLVRTVGFIPGGLGAFEAVAVLMLKTAGVPVAVGLSSSLFGSYLMSERWICATISRARATARKMSTFTARIRNS